ncbi:rRNA pseudouridine synthase [Anaerotignum lactatifermentans]|uniref:Pseudouridine synthase n=1 Tax=Anaerotignum lactatifermentans TaxID=160404 RepID=A0ABS2G5J3_9FIRM|nr:pseudouridine synthase [Anaerotignum lactatifermentans]MBM6828153.1 rRNA pseudouridine synthase [Anaerotignum lactatifermentans]MBM6876684.1 rRNA pseudouridine synthase [Anaerotignum lactatifermentans]MBM6949736.1 rRNA pseudouridine synthase [Anaerotignum lactatifermentans]
MEERLQKFLAEAGVASRRKAEELIAAGRVKVNGVVIREQGVKIDPKKDKVEFDGKALSQKAEKKVYLMLHKPEGYVTTSKEQFGRPAVLDLIHGVPERIFPVGRLDYDTSGLLLLTNDGDLTYRLTHPKHDVDKTYIAKLFGVPDDGELQKFRRGVTIDGRKTSPAKIQIISREKDLRFCTVEIQIHEGRNRQVRKMCEAIRHPVAQLKRTATGELKLGDLPKGKYRFLTEQEIKYLKSL